MIHVFLGISVLIMTGGGFGFGTLMTVIALFCASMNLNYCCVLIYIVYTMFDFLQLLDPVGLYFQNLIQSTSVTQISSSTLFVLIAMLVFEPIAIYFAFQAYKEFKGCLFDNGGSLGMGGGMVGRAVNTTGRTGQNISGAQNNNYNGNGTAYGGNPNANTSNTTGG